MVKSSCEFILKGLKRWMMPEKVNLCTDSKNYSISHDYIKTIVSYFSG